MIMILVGSLTAATLAYAIVGPVQFAELTLSALGLPLAVVLSIFFAYRVFKVAELRFRVQVKRECDPLAAVLLGSISGLVCFAILYEVIQRLAFGLVAAGFVLTAGDPVQLIRHALTLINLPIPLALSILVGYQVGRKAYSLQGSNSACMLISSVLFGFVAGSICFAALYFGIYRIN